MMLNSKIRSKLYGLILLVTALSLAACATPTDESAGVTADPPDFASPEYSGVSETLSQFGSEEAIDHYLAQREQRPSRWWYWRRIQAGFGAKALQDTQPVQDGCPVYDPDNPACFEFGEDDAVGDRIVVSGSRIATSMTNNQVASVDEGGVVKRIGNRIIVLRDGRLFLLNIGEGDDEPVLEARINLYDDPDEGTWFDELLVSNKRIVVIGYSYEYNASSYSIYDLSDAGEISFVGRFLVTSEDYFDGSSYAARMIDGDIVFEFPIDPEELAYADEALPSFFKPDANGDGQPDSVYPLIDPAEVYRPVADVEWPSIQVLVKCDLNGLAMDGPASACERVAFIASSSGSFYIGPDAAYYWSRAELDVNRRPPECRLERFNLAGATAVHRVDLDTMSLSVASAYGDVRNPFWMSAEEGPLYGFVQHRRQGCRDERSERIPIQLGLVRIEQSEFSQRYEESGQDIVRSLPVMEGAYNPTIRFFPGHLVYGASVDPDEHESGVAVSMAVSVDLTGERSDRIVQLRHSVDRIEAAHPETPILIGAASEFDLGVSALDLSQIDMLRASTRLVGRIEAESRTHAYNATTYQDAGEEGALMGLATLELDAAEGQRWWDYPEQAGVSFLRLEGDELVSLGAADPLDAEVADSYDCEVSCEDWYGVVRGFYLNNRVFALTNVELIEVDLLSLPAGLMVLNRTRLDGEPGQAVE